MHDQPGLQGKNILFGVTGSIAAFKAASWVHALAKEEARVSVIMTRAAGRFVSGLTFSALSGNRVYSDMFGKDPDQAMAHITLSGDADLILIAPATAQTIARLANGMADDLLSTAVLAAKKPVILCPAMNSNMWSHPATQANIKQLRALGYTIVEPDSGLLACGDEGAGRLTEWDGVREQLLGLFEPDDLQDREILITAGPTREPLDPVRYLTNRSSGKMGYALARTASRRGAGVRLIAGPVSLPSPPGIEVVHVTTARQMHDAVMEHAGNSSVIVKSAAVADFKPAECAAQKIKKNSGAMQLELVASPDILSELGKNKPTDQILVGFAAESQQHEQEGRRKLKEKNVDLMVVNDILGDKTGFDVDTNQVTLIDRNGSRQLPLLSKEATANRIWDHVVSLLNQ